MPDSFAHLHVHTEYSILDGASRLDDLISVAAADGQPALGITDHGNMYGVLDFYRGCQKAGIKPIIGTEAYMAREDRTERPARQGKVDDAGGNTSAGGKLYYHLTLLAADNVGYKNLIQVSSRAFLEGYYYKPRCDWETLSDHSQGLIATTGCLGAQVPQALMQGNEAEALKRASRFQDIFGRDSFFVEMQDHGIPEQRRIKPMLLEIARKLKAPLLATNDSHYTHRHQAEAHDALLCVQTASRLDDEDRLRFHGDEHYLKSAAEMRHLFGDMKEACDNTLLIAERADVTIEFGKPQLPHFPLPEGFEEHRDYLAHLTGAGARRRWGDPLPEPVADRLAYELEVINNMGFASYFLITWDLIAYARRRGIRVGPGRGSAAGCAVAYALRITDLDPIRYDLLFERFLNPERVSMPDIDMDFDSRYRDELINYAAERYGRDRVAQIITFGRIKARAAVRDAARVLGYPNSLGDKIAKAMPPLILGRDTPLRYCFEESEAHREGFAAAAGLREMVAADEEADKVVEVARGLEGLCRQDGIHAAAVVITREPLTEYMPIQRKPESGMDELAPVVTQYEMNGVEALGLLKLDFLGVRNLNVITDCVRLVEETRGVKVDIDDVDLSDSRTFELLRRGDTKGVFQLESTQVRALIRSLAPTSFDDVAALVALYRPGPMAANMHNDYADRKNGRKPVVFPHEDATDILTDTYGLMIYQENVMRIAQRFAGYSLAQADLLRKAMGKKIRSAMALERENFTAGVKANGYAPRLGSELFGIIEQFADYAFNKSHSYGYGLIAFQMAYLKANHPVEFFAALLTSVRNTLDSTAVYLNECRRRRIDVQVPDVNRSAADFTPVPSPSGLVGLEGRERPDREPGRMAPDRMAPDRTVPDRMAPGRMAPDRTVPDRMAPDRMAPDRIVYGLSSIRNVGAGFADSVIAEREANGDYESFADFVGRIDLGLINKRTVESLVKAGAFDSLGHPRKGLLQEYETIIERTVRRRKEQAAGVMSLFGGGEERPEFDALPSIPDVEFGRRERLSAEKEMLGLYVSDHPLSGLEAAIGSRADATVSQMAERSDGDFCSVGGVITGFASRYTRKGDLMATFRLEDLEGSVEVIVFPRTMAEHGTKLADDAVVVVRGRLDSREDAKRLVAQDVEPVERAEAPAEDFALKVRLAPEHHLGEIIRRVKAVLEAHPGSSPVQLHFGPGRRVARLPREFAVDTGNGVMAELKELLGRDAILP